MSKRARTAATRKKAHRFATLQKRRREEPYLFEAIERRQRQQQARLIALRAGFRDQSRAADSVESRREEYVEIARPAPSTAIPPAILTAIAASFVAPLVLAIVGGSVRLGPPPQYARQHASQTHVAGANLFAHAPAPVHVAHANSSARPPALIHVARANSFARPPAPIHVARAHASARPPAAPASNRPSIGGRFIASLLQSIFGVAPPGTPPTAHRKVSATRVAFRPMPAHQAATSPAKRPVPSPWSLSADGTWVASLAAPASMPGAAFSASTGQLIELERSAIAPDEATITIGWSRSVVVNISSQGQTITKTLPAPDAGIEAFDVAAAAVGPHLVDVGWTPLDASAQVSDYEIFRSSGEGERPELIATLPATKHSYHDSGVEPDARYRYSVAAETSEESIQASALVVQTPGALPSASAGVVSGKGMFLYFSSLAGDPRNFHHYNPVRVVAEAQRTGIHVIELRMARGACTMAQTQAAHAWLDELIDAAASANIKLLAWTVPRRATTQDLAETIAAAEYVTPSGNGFNGLALDLETGDNYMGDGPKARERMVQYIHDVRAATGPHYLIVATVASPRFGNQSDYPYAGIAHYADVLQPMEYWHYFDEAAHHEYGRGEVAGAAAAAVTQTRQLAGRDIPVNVAGQSVALEGTGAPSGREIRWSLDASKSGGAIGETFFDWAGTGPDAWAAIQAFDW